MKKLLLTISIIMLLLSCLLFVSCSGGAECQHRDANDDGLCDNCSVSYTDGKDLEDPVCQHRDINDDNLCDKCSEAYTDGVDVVCQHRDANDDGLCDKCALAYTDGKDVEDEEEHTHTFNVKNIGDEYLASPADCVNGALYYYTCSCFEVGTETFAVGDPLGHIEKGVPAVAPTCTEKGSTEGVTCTACNAVLTAKEEIAPLGHDEVSHEALEPTCTEIGYGAYVTCNRCDYTTYEEKAALGHTVATLTAVAPTCTATGLTEGRHCSVCLTVLTAQSVLPAEGHKYDDEFDEVCNTCGANRDAECAHTELETIPGKAATCTETGLTDGAKCKKCGEIVTVQESIPTLAHTEAALAAVAPTCTATGLTEGKKCSVCNTVLTSQETVAALGHDEKSHSAVAPGCTTPGNNAYVTCSRCNYTTYSEIAAIGHVAVTDPRVNPTCTATGLTEGRHCSVCFTVLTAQSVIPANGHIGGSAVKENETSATCTKGGSYSEVVYCYVCNAELSRLEKTLSALGHSYVSGECTRCGDKQSSDTTFTPPKYSGELTATVNGNRPFFTSSEITKNAFYSFSDLDSLGRTGAAFASLHKSLMPSDDRDSISHIHPSGWYYNGISNNKSYSLLGNNTIYNRTHLLAHQLLSDDVHEENFVTGTQEMNQKQMTKYENMVADYIKETGNHVMYRITPFYEGNNLICSGLLMEAYSVEDNGEGVEFCVYLFNVQPGIYINYLTGENHSESGEEEEDEGDVIIGTMPELGVAYRLYADYVSGIRYFNGTISYGLKTTINSSEAQEIYFESAGKDGYFYIYLYESGAKKYLVMKEITTTGIALSDTPDSDWYINEYGHITANVETGNQLGHRVISAQNDREDMRMYYEKNIGTQKYIIVKYEKVN